MVRGQGLCVTTEQHLGLGEAGRIAVGLDVDRRSNALFVAGGGPALGPIPGSGYVYDAETGQELAAYALNGLFVNDVVTSGTVEDEGPAVRHIVVTNWFEEMKARMGEGN